MKLIVHIFRKDALHFYPEILTSLALMLAFAWAAPMQWLGFTSGDGRVLLAGLLRVLLPLAWLVLLSRLVHDESLAGDRQFWVTRPYRWTTLLAAKLLFVLSFLGVPLFLMRLYLLHHAGLAVGPSLAQLVVSTGLLLLLIVLPFAAFATVTTNFSRQTIVLLAAIVYLIAVGFLTAMLAHWIFGSRITPPYLTGFLFWVVGIGLAAVIVLQYARRRTRLSWIVLAALPVAAAVLTLAAPDRVLIHSVYPAGPPAQTLSFDRDPNRQQPGSGSPAVLNGQVILQLPFTVNGPGNAWRIRQRGVSVAVFDGHGFQWASGYQEPGFSDEDKKAATLRVEMPLRIFERLKHTAVSLRLNVAEELYESAQPQTAQVDADGAFAAPGRAVCATAASGAIATCLYGLRRPPPINIVTSVTAKPCMLDRGGAAREFHGFLGSDESSLTLDFDPVVADQLTFIRASGNGARPETSYLCPGTAIQFTPTYLASRRRTDVAVDGIVLGPYAWNGRPAAHATDDGD